MTDVHTFFGLTYANYLILHRTILQSMPLEWQERFTDLLQEMESEFGEGLRDKLPDSYDIRVLARDPELVTIYEDCGNCEGNGEVVGRDCAKCDASGKDYDRVIETRYETPEEVGFIDDPIPHYNRGRTLLDLTTGEELRWCRHCEFRHTHSAGCQDA